ncbi:MAG TPA: acyltransferase [bacterium]
MKLGTNVQIEGDCFFDPSHCFLIEIEDHCALAPNVKLIAHDGSMYRFLGATRIGRIRLRRNCLIGDSTIILPGVTIGENSIVGSGSVVVKDVPPNVVAAGNPAKVICGLEEFLAKHRRNLESSRRFGEEEYGIRFITDEKRNEMLRYLADNPIAYMEGFTPDISMLNKRT